MRPLLLTAFLVLVLDQITKYAVVFAMDLRNLLAINPPVPFLEFRMAWNRGINFGILANDAEIGRWILIAVSLTISAIILRWLLRGWHPMPVLLFGGAIVGGALGNVIDRVLYGAVADFLNVSCCGLNNPYSFNIADIAIFVGAFGLVFFTGGHKTT